MNKYSPIKILLIFTGLLLLCGLLFFGLTLNPSRQVGDVLDEFNGVKVYYNGAVKTVVGRNVSPDGYNLGLKYQCVEFVKRYYFQRFQHKMPNDRGHAKDFFDTHVAQGALNASRGLLQFYNDGVDKPEVSDLLVFGPSAFNAYGHVAIVSKVSPTTIEIVQQNPGPLGSSRETYPLRFVGGDWHVESRRLLGWLRLPHKKSPR